MPVLSKATAVYNYVNAWLAYFGALFTLLSNIGNTVRDSITSLHIPKKSDFFT